MEVIETIQYGDYTAKINLSRGANCISLRKGEYQILREPDYSTELDNPYLYGMPILFPVNRISGGSFNFEGRTYKFPINEPETGCHLHGTLHQTKFCTALKTDSKIICTYVADNSNPYWQFGHDFKIDIEYEVDNQGFHQTVSIKNLSDKNMPVMIGFHTTFNTLFANGKKEDTYVFADISEEYERNMNNYLPTGKIPEFDDFSVSLASGTFRPFGNPISRHYKAVYGGKMIIFDRHNNLSLVYENDEKYGFRLIFNRGDFICLEPQNCIANCPNSPFERGAAGFDYIMPQEAKKYYSKINICDGDMRKEYNSNYR